MSYTIVTELLKEVIGEGNGLAEETFRVQNQLTKDRLRLQKAKVDELTAVALVRKRIAHINATEKPTGITLVPWPNRHNSMGRVHDDNPEIAPTHMSLLSWRVHFKGWRDEYRKYRMDTELVELLESYEKASDDYVARIHDVEWESDQLHSAKAEQARNAAIINFLFTWNGETQMSHKRPDVIIDIDSPEFNNNLLKLKYYTAEWV